jgi:magnesium transporter
MVATFIVARFESVLAAKPAPAFFVPGLVYLADAIGTQSEAVAMRGLSLSHVGIGRLIGGELRTGLLIGVVLALPWLLARFGSDPAYGSGPLATIVQDVLSVLIYFGSVSLIVL